MDRGVLTEIRRALSGKLFILGAGFILIMLGALSFEDISGYISNYFSRGSTVSNGFHNSYFLSKIISSEMMLVMPIVCALPAATAFIDDYNGKYIRFYLGRSGKNSYVMGKIAASVLSGGLVILIGALLYYGLLVLLVTPVEAALKDGETAPYYIQSIFKTLSLLFLNSALWAAVGLTLATVTMNRYVAYSGAFIIFYILVILYERYFPTLYVIYPKEWLSPSEFTQLNGFALPLMLLEMVAVLGLIFAILCERRFNEGV